MFWNSASPIWNTLPWYINRKYEMFWNAYIFSNNFCLNTLTVNMKCFEIRLFYAYEVVGYVLTVNMKCFEIKNERR